MMTNSSGRGLPPDLSQIKVTDSDSNGSQILYFAFGSNLFTQRIQINNPKACHHTIGKLQNYRLEFFGYSPEWRGATASVVESNRSEVWGVVWKIPLSELNNLDRQEGSYDVCQVPIVTHEGHILQCRTYQLKSATGEIGKPSRVYKACMVQGAIEHNLPQHYVEKLQNIEDNGYEGCVDIPVNIKKLFNTN
ncbi:gamma-glutamylcyclotransferase-like [Limulus polyphemus]|uniref:gamma-glutamylcyclotransferase n=1 Tax=Limulus polyphemus TaxID=6850 RepID=A0ABM1B0B2_LIMPO|nr:gamma-glutamylcyclotransferase-like [Limulus polyphemus]